MATENYGVFGELLASVAETPVSNDTTVVFIGAAKCKDNNNVSLNSPVNVPTLCTSLEDYVSKFGGGIGGGWSLDEAAEAAFSVCNLSKAYFINVNSGSFSSEDDVTASALLGDASLMSGVYALQKLYPDEGVIANVVCVPVFHTSDEVGSEITKDDILSALKLNVTKINGHFDGILVYDLDEASNQYNASNVVQIANISKDLADERAIASWGRVVTSFNSSGSVTRAISGAAVKAALYAKTDASQPGKQPCRSIGNLYLSAMKGLCVKVSGVYSPALILTESNATQLSADGITSFLNIGQGQYYTWGDHTSAFSNGLISDERGRFDSNIRMLFSITNRFQQKWRNSIDSPMTLALRNDVLAEENEYLAYLVSIGALVGDPICEFKPVDNPVENIQQGMFYFSSIATVTPPAKELKLGLAFTSEGYKVYIEQ